MQNIDCFKSILNSKPIDIKNYSENLFFQYLRTNESEEFLESDLGEILKFSDFLITQIFSSINPNLDNLSIKEFLYCIDILFSKNENCFEERCKFLIKLISCNNGLLQFQFIKEFFNKLVLEFSFIHKFYDKNFFLIISNFFELLMKKLCENLKDDNDKDNDYISIEKFKFVLDRFPDFVNIFYDLFSLISPLNYNIIEKIKNKNLQILEDDIDSHNQIDYDEKITINKIFLVNKFNVLKLNDFNNINSNEKKLNIVNLNNNYLQKSNPSNQVIETDINEAHFITMNKKKIEISKNKNNHINITNFEDFDLNSDLLTSSSTNIINYPKNLDDQNDNKFHNKVLGNYSIDLNKFNTFVNSENNIYNLNTVSITKHLDKILSLIRELKKIKELWVCDLSNNSFKCKVFVLKKNSSSKEFFKLDLKNNYYKLHLLQDHLLLYKIRDIENNQNENKVKFSGLKFFRLNDIIIGTTDFSELEKCKLKIKQNNGQIEELFYLKFAHYKEEYLILFSKIDMTKKFYLNLFAYNETFRPIKIMNSQKFYMIKQNRKIFNLRNKFHWSFIKEIDNKNREKNIKVQIFKKKSMNKQQIQFIKYVDRLSMLNEFFAVNFFPIFKILENNKYFFIQYSNENFKLDFDVNKNKLIIEFSEIIDNQKFRKEFDSYIHFIKLLNYKEEVVHILNLLKLQEIKFHYLGF